MNTTEWLNQFEIKDVYIEFVINNVSAQGNNNAKIKLNLKLKKVCWDCSGLWQRTKFLFSLIRDIFITL